MISRNTNYSTEILKYNGIELTNKYVNSLPQKEKLIIAKHLFKYFREVGFPYPEYTPQELKKDWKNLKNFDHLKVIWKDNIISQGHKVGLKVFKQFADCYFDVKTNKSNSKTMMEAFFDDHLLIKTINNRLGSYDNEGFNITHNMLRQGLRNSYSAASISIAKPSIYSFIFNSLAPQDGVIYDYSMGMGQRLMRALASPKNFTYLAVDPWDGAQQANLKILKFIKTIDNVKEPKLAQTCSTKASQAFPEFKQKVDLACSSPPFFDLEVFSPEADQAYFNGYDDFVNNWWRETVRNTNSLLKPDGYFVLNMGYKAGKFEILEDMLKVCDQEGFEEEQRFLIKSYRMHMDKVNPRKFEPIVVMRRK